MRCNWLTGASYIPAIAINEMELWQADTFDAMTIDRELGWAANLGDDYDASIPA